MIKRILVPTDGSEAATVGCKYGIELARQLEGKIHGYHVIDIRLLEGPFLRDISASLGTAPFVNYQNNISMVLEARGKAILEAFEDLCEASGVVCETSQDTAALVRSIVEKSELFDLLVLGRGGEHSEWLDGIAGSTTQAVIRRTGQPVLVTATAEVGRKRLLVAFDGSKSASHALQLGTSLAESWGSALEVLAVGSTKGESMLEEARSYLEAHNMNATYTLREGDPSEAITGYATESGAELLIMGAFGHSKMREWVVGSVTAYVLDHAPCPLLLVH